MQTTSEVNMFGQNEIHHFEQLDDNFITFIDCDGEVRLKIPRSLGLTDEQVEWVRVLYTNTANKYYEVGIEVGKDRKQWEILQALGIPERFARHTYTDE
ncbi:hypothetical protein V0288_11155 [Pannus brasiliensis CCIBt3594]|uniref:Uncharacterized protein n=1 Tax=Pannus brasiliensis CCIBt3594 TaxID=1427578 RepID=A0AAW9QUF6_9CHRO